MGPTTSDKQARAEEVIQYLLGTINSMPDDAADDLDICRMVDDEIFLCDTCGWWCELSEMDEDCEDTAEQICQECADE